jgi:hypothetical protein
MATKQYGKVDVKDGYVNITDVPTGYFMVDEARDLATRINIAAALLEQQQCEITAKDFVPGAVFRTTEGEFRFVRHDGEVVCGEGRRQISPNHHDKPGIARRLGYTKV